MGRERQEKEALGKKRKNKIAQKFDEEDEHEPPAL